MLRLLFFLTCGLTLLSAPAFSQVDFADLEDTPKKEKVVDTTAKPIDKGVFDNAVYFKAGRSVPVGKFGQAPSMDKTTFDSFDGKDGTGAQPGFTAEAGLIYFIHKLPIPKQFRFGIDASLAYSRNKVVWANMPEKFKLYYSEFLGTKDDDSYNIFAGAKVGPVLSYNVMDKLIADVYFKFNPSFTNVPQISYEEFYLNKNNKVDSYQYYFYADYEDRRTFSLRKSLGFNLRYSNIIAGLEYNYGRVGYTLHDYYDLKASHNDFSGNEPERGSKNQKVSMPSSMLLWTIGLKF